MNNACPGCGAVYNVSSKDIGRHLKCKKCGSPMVITATGIEAEGAAPPPAYTPGPEINEFDPPPSPRGGRRRANIDPNQIAETYQKHGGLISTGLFGLGAFLIIFHLFMPLIGDAKTAGREARKANRIRYYQEEEARINKDMTLKDKQKLLEEMRKEQEKELKDYDDDIASARLASRTSMYMDRYFMMFGFLLVMVGSLLFMMPEQPLIKRIVGAVIVTSQLVFVFLVYLTRSAASG